MYNNQGNCLAASNETVVVSGGPCTPSNYVSLTDAQDWTLVGCQRIS